MNLEAICEWLDHCNKCDMDPPSEERFSNDSLAIEKCLDSIKEYFDCVICHDSLEKPIQTQCGHVFCGRCLHDLCRRPSPTCPLCKSQIAKRTLITRDDIGDMMELVGKLKDVFNEELENFISSKKKRGYGGTTTRDRKSSVSDGRILGVPDKEEQLFKDKTGDGGSSCVDKPQKTINSKSRSNSVTEVVLDDEIQDLDEEKEKTVSVARKKAATKTQNKLTEKPGDAIKQKNEKLNQLMKQTYAIISADVTAENPLDLSVPRRVGEECIEYSFKSAVRFVTPLDLSKKNEKRKCDEMDDNSFKSPKKNAKSPRKKQVTPHPMRKKGNFENKEKIQEEEVRPPPRKRRAKSEEKKQCKTKKSHFENRFEDDSDCLIEKDVPIFTPTPPPVPPQVEKQSKEVDEKKSEKCNQMEGVVVDFENLYEADGSPIPRDHPVFTPTPSPPKNPAKNVENTSVDKPSSHGEQRFSRISQSHNYLVASEVLREFDKSFEEDVAVPASSNPSLPSKVTHSDEMLSKLMDENETLQGQKDKTKVGTPAQLTRRAGSVTDEAGRKKKDFTFKQPGACVSQAAKKKPKDGISIRDEILMDFDDDDDFQQPRDSDLLFLDVSMSGLSGGSGVAKSAKSDSKVTHGNRRTPESDGEKENGPASRSLSKPSKSKTPSKEKTISLQSKGPTNEDVYVFDDDDDDLLLDIPETSAKGKSSEKKKKNEEKTKASVDTPSRPIQKQRYVFCPSRLSKSQTIMLQKLCTMCNGTISKDFNDDVTHLIIQLTNGRVPQTLKYLLAIAGRKWVVIFDWVEECVKKGKIVSEADFETSNFEQCDPGVRLSRLAEYNLFDGFKFYFAVSIYNQLGFTKAEVEKLLESLGGTVVDSAESRYRELIIIGSMNGNLTMYNDWLNTNKWVTVTFDWVIDCILEYRLKPFQPKHLCVDTSKMKYVCAPKAIREALTYYNSQRLSLGQSPSVSGSE